MNPISAASSIPSATSINVNQATHQANTSTKSAGTSTTGGFSELVEGFVQSTNQSQVASDQAIADLVKGDTDNVQQVVMAVANAEMSFQLFMEIRNKLVDSYNELMRMQF